MNILIHLDVSIVFCFTWNFDVGRNQLGVMSDIVNNMRVGLWEKHTFNKEYTHMASLKLLVYFLKLLRDI